MKVNDLFEKLAKPMTDVRTSKKEMHKEQYPLHLRKWEKLGTPGLQAAAYLPKAGSNVVVKTVNIKGPSDPVYQFVRMVRKHQDNPYFPKIRTVKVYPLVDPSKGKVPRKHNYKLVLTMEKLYHLGQTMYPIIEQLFGFKFDQPQDIESSSKQMKYRHFGSAQWRKEAIQRTTDPNLKEALRLLEPLFRTFIPDMHLGNLMLRRTGGRPQIVFADPVI